MEQLNMKATKSNLIKILIVEDDDFHSMALENQLQHYSKINDLYLDITIATTPDEAESLLRSNNFDMGFLDLHLKDHLEGLELLEKFKAKIYYPIVLTSQDKKEIITRAYDLGCKDYLQKPFKKESIEFILNRFYNLKNGEQDKELIFSKYITGSQTVKNELVKLVDLRNNEKILYIHGETGTGKQVVAEIAHLIINNQKGNFIEENCASIPEALAESILFGHKKGAFTGANEDKKGLFDLANNGTLFLDEIGKLPLSIQGKLLKVIQQRKYRPLKGTEEKTFNGLLITASCENLKVLVTRNEFRKDLLRRINGSMLNLIPLRERKEDIEYQLNYFINNHYSGRKIVITDQAMKYLKDYDWSGNTGQLIQEVNNWHSKGLNILTLNDIIYLEHKKLNTQEGFINDKLLSHVEQKGLDETLHTIANEIINYFHIKNKGKVRKTIRNLNISSRKFYKYKEEVGS